MHRNHFSIQTSPVDVSAKKSFFLSFPLATKKCSPRIKNEKIAEKNRALRATNREQSA